MWLAPDMKQEETHQDPQKIAFLGLLDGFILETDGLDGFPPIPHPTLPVILRLNNYDSTHKQGFGMIGVKYRPSTTRTWASSKPWMAVFLRVCI